MEHDWAPVTAPWPLDGCVRHESAPATAPWLLDGGLEHDWAPATAPWPQAEGEGGGGDVEDV